MKGLFIPEITAEMFKNGCLESIEALMAEGEIYDIEYSPWIPVSERLPKESDGLVLVCMPDKSPYNITQHFPNCKVLQRVKMASHSEYTNNWYSSMGGYVDEPLAWMPLPEPYESESEDRESEDKKYDRCG